MEQVRSAVYEHGSLRLLEPLELAESSQVQIQILSAEPDFQTSAFHRQLTTIRRLLASVENDWNDDLVRQCFPSILQSDLHTLWQVGREPHRTLCALLQLSVAQLKPDQLTRKQIAAIHFSLDLLEQESLTETGITACHARLIDSALCPLQSALTMKPKPLGRW